MPRDLDARPTALYRLRDDAGQLLYVGITTDPEERFRQHAGTSPWWPLVQDRAVEWHATRPVAEAAEATAIKDEAPAYNVAGSSTRQTLIDVFPPAEEVPAGQLRVRLADVVHETYVRNRVTYITKNGRRCAALVPLEVVERAETATRDAALVAALRSADPELYERLTAETATA